MDKAHLDLLRSMCEVEGFNESLAKYATSYSDEGVHYARTNINQRFSLEDPKTGTVVDLCFEGGENSLP